MGWDPADQLDRKHASLPRPLPPQFDKLLSTLNDIPNNSDVLSFELSTAMTISNAV